MVSSSSVCAAGPDAWTGWAAGCHLADGVVRLHVVRELDEQVAQPGARHAQPGIPWVGGQRAQRGGARKAHALVAVARAHPAQDLRSRRGHLTDHVAPPQPPFNA